VNHLHGLRVLRIAYGLSYGNICDSGNYDYVTAFRLRHGDPLKSPVYEHLIYLSLRYRTVRLAYGHGLALFYYSSCNSPYAQSSDVVVIGQRRYLKLQRFFPQVGIGLAVLCYGFKQRRQVEASVSAGALLYLFFAFADGHSLDVLRLAHRHSLTGDAVKYREVELPVVGLKIHEQLVNFVYHFVDSGVFFIQLVDEKDRVYPLLERFLEHESCLRHWTLAGIHQQYHCIHSLHDSFHF